MTVKDLLKMEVDIDVYDDVCEELAIAFCIISYVAVLFMKNLSKILPKNTHH